MRNTMAVATLLAAAVTAGCAEDGTNGEMVDAGAEDEGATTVRPGRASWYTGYFQAAVYAELLRELGYDVADPADHEFGPEQAYIEMASGTFDFWANGWFSQHYTHFENILPDGSKVADHVVVIGRELPKAALEGLVITKSVAEEHGIASLDQINADPALVALFDADGDGLAEIHGCQEDWTCDDIINEMIVRNGWTNLEQVVAGYPGLAAVTVERVRAGEPAIQYVWSPSGYLFDLYPGETVLWLSLGGHEHVIDGTTPGGQDFSDAPPAPFGSDCTADPCWIGWEVADIQVAANKDFAEANPKAAALFDLVEISLADIASQNLRYDAGENTEADLVRHAEEWIGAHRDVVDDWLATARAADTS